MGGALPGQVVLECVRKLAELAIENKPRGADPFRASAGVPALVSLSDGL